MTPPFNEPSQTQSAGMVRRALADFARRMRSLRADHGVSATRLSVLGRLYRAGRAMTATELATLERLQPQSLTRVIADLEERALIRREPNASDRRQLDIMLTPAGIELLWHDASAQDQWLADAMATQLTPAERCLLMLAAELLDRIADHEIVASPGGTHTEAISDNERLDP